MSNNEKVITISRNIRDKACENINYIQGVLGLVLNLTCCKTAGIVCPTLVPEHLYPIVQEALERLQKVQESFFSPVNRKDGE